MRKLGGEEEGRGCNATYNIPTHVAASADHHLCYYFECHLSHEVNLIAICIVDAHRSGVRYKVHPTKTVVDIFQ